MDPKRLRSVPLFEGVSRKDLQQLGRWADEVEIGAGKRLMKQGESSYEFFVIEEGDAEVIQGDQVIRRLGPGDFFGELALLETPRRTASVVSRTPMRLIVMHTREFKSMEHEMPRVAEQVREAVRQRMPQRSSE